MRRSDRLVQLSHLLLEHPATPFTLGQLGKVLGVAKSTISEDLDLVGESLAGLGLGRLESHPGAAGGVVFRPIKTKAQMQAFATNLCARLREPHRILTGGFIYMTDLIFTPEWTAEIGRTFASRFAQPAPDYVITVETKGIPLALMTARYLNRPLVVIRRDARVTEGPSVGINFLSGSTGRIQTMSLPRRAVPPGAKVLLIDDFMKAGGTARGMMDLMSEFEARVLGLGVLVETAEPARKLVRDRVALAVLDGVDEKARRVSIRPAEWVSAVE